MRAKKARDRLPETGMNLLVYFCYSEFVKQPTGGMIMQVVEFNTIPKDMFLRMYAACFHIDLEEEPYSLTREDERALLDFEELRVYEGEAKIRRIREKAAAWAKGERARYTYELFANALSDIELAFAAKEYGMLVPEEYLRGLSEQAGEEMLTEEARAAGCSLEEFTELRSAFGKRQNFTAAERERLAIAQKKKTPLAALVLQEEAERDFAVRTQTAEAAYGKEYLVYREGVLQAVAEQAELKSDAYYLKIYETLHGALSSEEKEEDQKAQVDPSLPLHREVYIDLMQQELQEEDRILTALANQYVEGAEAYFAGVGRYAKDKERVA
ncbi:Hypothetical protein LUCI_3870 [Lucifera butyrica]|uniref:Uncharacterized protein n=1 Tax=Lucifera butyrica TaxID=1351585 RepID=A0A498RER2_9FIRM|nr:hypothetical protein [Lucifera butyrica]VBB08592.1 Hypothetical protein LUCI_3870 [Lucifera butyrica]